MMIRSFRFLLLILLATLWSSHGRAQDRYPLKRTGPAGQRVAAGLAGRPTPSAPLANQATEVEAARVVAVVGDEHILAGEVNAETNLFMAPRLLKLPPEVWEREGETLRKQLAQQREQMFKPMLQRVIDYKILFTAYMTSEVPSDKLEEAKKSIKERVDAAFPDALEEARQKIESATPERLEKLMKQDSQVLRLAVLMREAKILTLGELDQLLRGFGSSLAQQKRTFAERSLGQQLILKKINRNPEITHEQLLDHYYKNIKTYEVKAQAKWEQLSVHFKEIANKDEAYRKIAEMGNMVVYGANFGSVAKRHSHGTTADEGGKRDWTSKGSLVSKPLDNAIFSMPVNRLSRVIEDSRGFHIIRVVERKAAGRIAFRDAQVEIRKELRSKTVNKDYQQALVRLRKTVPVRILR